MSPQSRVLAHSTNQRAESGWAGPARRDSRPRVERRGKRSDSTYQPGRRSRSWVKTVVRRKAHLIVAGCVSGRAGAVGALALAAYDNRGSLTYCGAVRSGLHAKGGRALYEQLRGLKPATVALLPYGGIAELVQWVQPRRSA
ncbi:hypothetical protein [Mycobacterium sp.]|uniref:ATP dependent DNA ligase n=1 Tax=Mycobacterium sp. TaxID=1785 RepID=UPI00338FAA4C